VRWVTGPRRTCARPLMARHCRRPATPCGLSILIASVCVVGPAVSAQQPEAVPKFRTGVTVVPITAVVRDARGRLVRDLSRDDFEVFENGRPRPVVDFRSTGHTPISLALLFDTSGSMRDANLEQGKSVVEAVVGRMEGAWDEMALITFDKVLREETPFTNKPEVIRTALAKMVAWGQTSLYDAIAETAKRLGDRRTQRRAVMVITDGVDTSSTLTPEKVSELASALEVPVYVLTVAPPRRRFFGADDTLANLARWTGGDHVPAHAAEHLDGTVSDLMTELRQLYFLAIDSAVKAGSYRLEVRTKGKGLKVRARSGYIVTQ
jgi:Ca-activated chloride channel family protein